MDLFDKDESLEAQMKHLDAAEVWLDTIHEQALALNRVTGIDQCMYERFKAIIWFQRQLLKPQLDAQRAIEALLKGEPIV